MPRPSDLLKTGPNVRMFTPLRRDFFSAKLLKRVATTTPCSTHHGARRHLALYGTCWNTLKLANMSQIITTAVSQLESALDAFQTTLEDSKFVSLRPALKSTTSSDLNVLLQQQDECRQPSLNLTVSLSPITKIFQLTYKLGHSICGLDETVLQQLYGVFDVYSGLDTIHIKTCR
jgi:hypothetical protein